MNALLLNTFRLCCAALAVVLADQCWAEPSSWVFLPSTYTHDPYSGARVAQYERLPAVEPLEDPRLVTSRHRRVRTTVRGADGSVDSTYEVQSYGNDRGGMDAQWERFHDAWRQSTLTGSYYYRNQPAQYGSGYGYPGFGRPGSGHPGYGRPGYGRPVHPHGAYEGGGR